MLQDHFFEIVDNTRKDALTVVLVKLNEQHPVFAGHFPGKPVVPGVFTLQMIKECVEKNLQKKLRYTALQNCKFSNVILPDARQLIAIEYECEQKEQGIQLKVSVKSGDTVYVAMKAQLAITNE